jgi:pimeloyl-ACP methyl ester carboxylesterase
MRLAGIVPAFLAGELAVALSSGGGYQKNSGQRGTVFRYGGFRGDGRRRAPTKGLVDSGNARSRPASAQRGLSARAGRDHWGHRGRSSAAASVNVLDFDYRGYGESQFARPSDANWRQDAKWALDYLTGTRQIDAGSIVLYGAGLGANLAFEIAAEHPELAGVIVDSPMADPMSAIFNDARARMVPARLLVRDRYDMARAAGAVRIPVLWFEPTAATEPAGATEEPQAYKKVVSHKMLVWVDPAGDRYKQTEDALSRWLDELAAR